jgi:hypothetical protein
MRKDASIREKTLNILNSEFPYNLTLSSVPSLVQLNRIDRSLASGIDFPSVIHGRNSGARALESVADDLDEGWHKASLELKLENQVLCSLTSLITKRLYHSTADALIHLSELGNAIPRRVCQFPFKRNDIVWVCRTCQADETCVLCHACFSQSNHEGHDVAFYHAQAGGCCDCGDPDAWNPLGFCPHHGRATACESDLPLSDVQEIVQTIADWLVTKICPLTEQQFTRTRQSDSVSPITDGSRRPLDSSYELTFDTNAASSSRSRGDSMPTEEPGQRLALELGILASREQGVYLVLHSDDIHSKHQVVTYLRRLFGGTYLNESLLTKLVSALQTHGQLVVWGTMEILGDLSPSQRLLWLDGDIVASRLVGAKILERASRLKDLSISISTRNELLWEQRAVALLEWCTVLARSCDPLCQIVAESILPERHLVPMLRSDFWLSSRITKIWHSLLLTLLAVPTFKSHLAAAYCDTYRHVTSDYAKGVGVLERSSYTLSVQFLNRVNYVVDLVQNRDLLGKLGKALHETLAVALEERRLNPNHYCLSHRRYSPCISDMKCVLNVKGMARLFMSKSGSFLEDWLASLSLAQWMDPQVWRTYSQGHVENEPRGWVGAFNASISLGSLFERLLGWHDDDPSPAPKSPLSENLPTIVDLTKHCWMEVLIPWQRSELEVYLPTSNSPSLEAFAKAPASLPYPTTHNGLAIALKALPMPQIAPWSFHLPLHRFLASCFREVCRRAKEQGMDKLMSDLVRHHDREIFQNLIQFPMIVLSRAAQIRVGLWRRNGSLMSDQVLNYAEPPFCRALRDADVLLLQVATLGCGTGYTVSLLLHRFSIFDLVGLRSSPQENPELYEVQVAEGLYPGEIGAEEFNEVFPCPWTFIITDDEKLRSALLEEFLHLVIIMICELPPVPPSDKADHTLQAKCRLRREVIHRLASGPKTHSELSEVHHVLSNWDNLFLSEEGRLVNPDDATGAALGATLTEVAEHKSIRGPLEPKKWVLREKVWEEYDPAFFHISLRSHEQASESRPKVTGEGIYGIEARPYAPPPPDSHPSFCRLRRDFTSDATILAVCYRILHNHCCESSHEAHLTAMSESSAYTSETVLARVIHLLTLGAFSWESAVDASQTDWRELGGDFEGSIFRNYCSAPTVSDWISYALLSNPAHIMKSNWYEAEEPAILLLKRLAKEGGSTTIGFVAQDQAVKAGAAWLCDFACKYSKDASKFLTTGISAQNSQLNVTTTGETDIERKQREAKARAMDRMNKQAARFAAMMNIDTEDSEEEKEPIDATTKAPLVPVLDGANWVNDGRRLSSGSLGGDSEASMNSSASYKMDKPTLGSCVDIKDTLGKNIPRRLFKVRPTCIICNDDNDETARNSLRAEEDGSSHRKRSRRKADRSNALAFVGYTQPSTVLKGGGGVPPTLDNHSSFSSLRRFVGLHVALCGHAVHSECCESYLSTVSHRDDRIIGRREEFKCPLCQRLSNCLVPFIDVAVDWVDHSKYKETTTSVESMVTDEGHIDPSGSFKLSIHQFLMKTSWWVGRDDKSVVWDGQSAFISSLSTQRDESIDSESNSDAKPRRRSIRSLRKKDLYAAWSAMMRTPRFIRRKQLTRSTSDFTADQSHQVENFSSTLQSNIVDDASNAETLVWRRFMDNLSDIANRADAKRLGELQFLQYCGEFRHYYTEKQAFNYRNRLEGRESSDWPACISTTALTENRRQELSREKLLSKLLVSIQAFTYSCCVEAYEIRRLLKKEKEIGGNSMVTFCQTFGIAGFSNDDDLLIMPSPRPDLDEGFQPFEGRFGKLRYLGLAVMAAAGPVSLDLIQLVLGFPLATDEKSVSPSFDSQDCSLRAPIVFPILLGHILTHVVAAMCASCGRTRARSDSLDSAWWIPVSTRVQLLDKSSESGTDDIHDLIKDCKGFIGLGLLARLLQVLLGKLQIDPSASAAGRRVLVLKCIKQIIVNSLHDKQENELNSWNLGCASLIEAALSCEMNMVVVASAAYESDVSNRFNEACQVALDAAISFLSDIGIIYQVLVPGVIEEKKYPGKSLKVDNHSLAALNNLTSDLGLESVHVMLESHLVRHILANWFSKACEHVCTAETPSNDMSRSVINKMLFQAEGFRVFDWPMETCRFLGNKIEKKNSFLRPSGSEPHDQGIILELNPFSPTGSARAEFSTSPVSQVMFSSKKCVEFIGGYVEDRNIPMIARTKPRISMLPTSYTDLYAELGNLCPDSEQIALCLICGEVLNANGRGECTRHSFQCGAGACIFFLLQECQGLLMHNSKAVYVQSPYVDNHGETPQYRGRPLNLDVERYNVFRELWTSHGIRQKVIQERGAARQVIIADFY